MRKLFLSKIDASSYLELFFISAVSTILLTRFYLALSKYPQIGGGGLHIAHMLWGGLLMLISIIFLLSFSGKFINFLSAILSGIGFGLFIDELGKFITSDNNYFFEPAIALIYLIFVLLYMVFKLVQKTHTVSYLESLENSLDYIKFALVDSSLENREKAITLLEKIENKDEFVKNLLSSAKNIKIKESKGSLRGLKNNLVRFYSVIAKNKWFLRGVVLFFVGFSILNLYRSAGVLSLYFKLNEFSLSFADWGQFLSSILSAIIVVIGIVRLRFSKIGGYKMFRISLLVSIFLTQFFDFYTNQIEASYVLIFNIVVYLLIGNIIEEEKSKQAIITRK